MQSKNGKMRAEVPDKACESAHRFRMREAGSAKFSQVQLFLALYAAQQRAPGGSWTRTRTDFNQAIERGSPRGRKANDPARVD
jgi:hypothetical protein